MPVEYIWSGTAWKKLGGPATITPTPGGSSSGVFEVQYSLTSITTGLLDLDGATVDTNVYVVLTVTSTTGPISEVRWNIDGVFQRTETSAPYTLAVNGAATALVQWGAFGSHLCRAAVHFADGTIQNVDANFTTEAGTAPAPPVITGVNVTPSDTFISVGWTTSTLSTSRVDFGTTTAYGGNISDSSLVTGHFQSPFGLTPLTTYHYRVRSTDGYGQETIDVDRTIQTLDVQTGGGGDRGPTGFHWHPETPAYNTPANITNVTVSQLNSVLATQAQSGWVIEMAPGTYTVGSAATPFEITGGKASWSQNVLVRPPIGDRQSVIIQGYFRISSPHVTIAGWQFNSNEMRVIAGGHRSGYARCICGTNCFVAISCTSSAGLNDPFMYEIIKLGPTIDTDMSNFSATSSVGQGRNYVISGCWFESSYLTPNSGAHTDTLQVFDNGGDLGNVLVEDTVLFASANSAYQTQSGVFNQTVRNCWIGHCDDPRALSDPIPVGKVCNNHVSINGGGANRSSLPVGGPYTFTGTPVLTLIDCDVTGAVNAGNAPPATNDGIAATNSHFRTDAGFEPGSAVIIGSGNTFNSALVVDPPSFPNLNAIWGT